MPPMRCFRRRKNLHILPWLFACAVLLRSFVAPGFMLSASSENGLDIIFCDGLVSLVSSGGHVDHHQHHGGGDDQSEVHISPICSQWSTSSLLVIDSFYVPEPPPSTALPEPDYQSPFIQQFSSTLRPNRGPPFLS